MDPQKVNINAQRVKFHIKENIGVRSEGKEGGREMEKFAKENDRNRS